MNKLWACIGNPPYQDQTLGGNSTYAPPIYHLFIDGSADVADRVELIHPARFLFDAGSTPKAWNRKMLEDDHFKVLHYEPDATSVFPGTDIKGGVAVTLHDDTRCFEPIHVFFPHEALESITRKVQSKGEKSISSIIYASESYRFTDTMHSEVPGAEKLLSKGHKYDLKTSVLSKLDGIVFFADDVAGDYASILGLVKGKRCHRWIKRDYLRSPDNFEKYKVILPKSNGSGALGEQLSSPIVEGPGTGHTQSFMSIGCFDTRSEATSCLKYIKTKFTRTLLGVLKVTQDNPAPKWAFIPIQDFTASSDIDWSKSVAEIDQQLYRKYGLSDEEIDFIETRVKEMK